MHISFITTVEHNVGDDFVREGLKYLLSKHYAKTDLEFANIHKHSPITARKGFAWFRNWMLGMTVGKVIDSLLPYSLNRDLVMEADMVVQSGAPVYWCFDGNHCAHNEWYSPLIRSRYSRNSKKHKKLLNIAAGTCQPFHSDGNELVNCPKCSAYIKEFYQAADVTTVRDRLAQEVLLALGLDAPLIPCTSIFAMDAAALNPEPPQYVVVNFMKRGAHYSLGQSIDEQKWCDEFTAFYFKLKKKERVIFSCHNQGEYKAAHAIDPNAEIFYEKNDFRKYLQFYSKAKLGIMNRVHGAFVIASFGRPALIVGNDTRATMGNEIDLENVFVNDVDQNFLWQRYEKLLAEADAFKTRFSQIKEAAYKAYMDVLKSLP